MENEKRISTNRKKVLDYVCESNVFSGEWRKNVCEALKNLEIMQIGQKQNGNLHGIGLEIAENINDEKFV